MLKLTLRAALGALIAVMAVLATPALAFDHPPWTTIWRVSAPWIRPPSRVSATTRSWRS